MGLWVLLRHINTIEKQPLKDPGRGQLEAQLRRTDGPDSNELTYNFVDYYKK